MKSRETRHTLLVRARMNAGAGWRDACILNVSSHGLMLQSAEPPARGSFLEIRRGGQSIVAQVMWTKRHRFGVKTQDPLPVMAMIANLNVDAAERQNFPGGERRAVPRTQIPAGERGRQRGRIIEYGFAAALATFGAVAVAAQVYSLLGTPFQQIALALGD